jgi:hypothetical protein
MMDTPELKVLPLGDAYMARLEGVHPVFARLASLPDGWSVALIAFRFDSLPEMVATGLTSLEAATDIAKVALKTVRAALRLEAYRFRFQEHGVNRWYVDVTARHVERTVAALPNLAGKRHPRPDRVQRYMDTTFPHMINLAQHRPHFDPARGRTTDPNEHTVEVMELLKTRGLAARERLLARVAVLYHDIGKGVDSFDPMHPAVSARLAAPLLDRHGLSADEQAQVLVQIREHDLLGMLNRGRISHDEAIRRLNLTHQPRNLPIHFAITTADISAIRGLRWVVDQGHIASAHQALLATLEQRET